MTKAKNNHSRKQVHREPSYLNWFLTRMFLKAWPVWERYRGPVPPRARRELDRRGNWPRGVATAIMKRLTEDEDLRRRLRQLARQRRTTRGQADEPAA